MIDDRNQNNLTNDPNYVAQIYATLLTIIYVIGRNQLWIDYSRIKRKIYASTACTVLNIILVTTIRNRFTLFFVKLV